MTLEELLWQHYVPSRLNLSEGSAKQIEYAVNSFGRSLGSIPTTADMTATAMQAWMRAELPTLSRYTIRRYRSRLLTLWRWAWRKRLCEQPPPDDIEPIRVPRRIPRAWSLGELEAIIGTCRELPGGLDGINRADWWESLNLFLYDTGARLNAAMLMHSTDVDLDSRACILRAETAKTGVEQAVCFSVDTAAAIRQIYDCDRRLVWQWPFGRRYLHVCYKSILRAAKVDASRYVGFHRMRKTHATQAVLVAGWEAASRDLGHTSVRMTQAYVDPRQLPTGRVEMPRLRTG